MKTPASLQSTSVLIMVLIVCIWALAYPVAASLPENVFKEPLSSSYGALNVLFTALAFGGVVITLIFQANQAKIAQKESMERSILDMFQTFTSDEFQRTKDAAFRVLITAIKHKEYADFVASRLFAVAQLPRPVSAEIRQTVLGLEGNRTRTDAADFEKMERADRLKLDDILNFFAMLAQRESASEIVKHVDFAYDWWRPALLLIAQSQIEHQKRHPEIKEYCRNNPIMDTIRTLDTVFGHTQLNSDQEVWAYLFKHPKMIDFKLDPQFASDRLQT
jgi:hypothetical protein